MNPPQRDALHLPPEAIEAIAARVVEMLRAEIVRAESPATTPPRLTAADVAKRLGVTRDHVYRHAGELGGSRLGDGPRARLRFSAEKVEAYVATRSGESPKRVAKAPQRRRPRRPGGAVELLPVKGTAN